MIQGIFRCKASIPQIAAWVEMQATCNDVNQEADMAGRSHLAAGESIKDWLTADRTTITSFALP